MSNVCKNIKRTRRRHDTTHLFASHLAPALAPPPPRGAPVREAALQVCGVKVSGVLKSAGMCAKQRERYDKNVWRDGRTSS